MKTENKQKRMIDISSAMYDELCDSAYGKEQVIIMPTIVDGDRIIPTEVIKNKKFVIFSTSHSAMINLRAVKKELAKSKYKEGPCIICHTHPNEGSVPYPSTPDIRSSKRVIRVHDKGAIEGVISRRDVTFWGNSKNTYKQLDLCVDGKPHDYWDTSVSFFSQGDEDTTKLLGLLSNSLVRGGLFLYGYQMFANTAQYLQNLLPQSVPLLQPIEPPLANLVISGWVIAMVFGGKIIGSDPRCFYRMTVSDDDLVTFTKRQGVLSKFKNHLSGLKNKVDQKLV